MATCPSCNAGLAKVPTRKTRCRHCGEFIFVKRAPGESEKRLVTPAQALRIENAWALRHERATMADWLSCVGLADRASALDLHETLEAVRQATRLPLAEVAALHKNPYHRKMAHLFLAQLEAREGNADRAFMHLRQGRAAELDEIASDGIDLVDLLSHRSDPVCAAMSRRSIPIHEARRDLPIPNSSCPLGIGKLERGFCICSFAAAAEWFSRRR